MRSTKGILCAVALLGAFCVGCAEPTPVGTLAVQPTQIDLGYPGYSGLQLSWEFTEAPQDVQGALRVFVHLNDELGAQARTFDHELPFDSAAQSTGDYTINLFQSALAPPLTAGAYNLTVGLHDGAGNRWPLEIDGVEVDDFEYEVAKLQVSDASGEFPMFYFSTGWLQVEGGTDRQILGRRWLSEPGTVTVSEMASAGSVLLIVGVPSKNEEGRELVMENEGDTELAVTVSTACGGYSTTITGTGSHEITVPIAAGEEGEVPAECVLEFQPNFHLVSMDTLERRTIALEGLSWAPGV